MSELSEVHGGPLVRNLAIQERFQRVVENHPDHLALVCVHQPAGLYQIPNQPLDDESFRQSPYLRWSYRHLRDGIHRLVQGLRAAGVEPGMPFFTFNYNSAEHVLAYHASIEIGCVFVPINPRNFSNREELVYMINTAKSVTPGKRPVAVTCSSELATQVDELGIFDEAVKVVVSTDAVPNWKSFEALMSLEPTSAADGEVNSRNKVIDGLVVFTSGTTSKPKGCFTQHPMLANTFETDARMGPNASLCCVVPNNHSMGHLTCSICHTAGAALIYPGPGFQADTVMQTLLREKVTEPESYDTSGCARRYPGLTTHSSVLLVPTMIHALVGLKAASGHQLDHLDRVVFGGAILTPKSLNTCITELGAKSVSNNLGMTEVGIMASGVYRDVDGTFDGEEVSVGRVQTGVALRVADPGNHTVLPRNCLGELHASCASLQGYIGGIGGEAYYHDKTDGRLWFKTGDQARMDDAGRLFVTGRYKDMIIRGGENMSSSAIEAAISNDPQLARLNPQVVAAPDVIAGEVPVAVVMGRVDAGTKEKVQNAVSKTMGRIYVPDDVVSLEDLGFPDYPRTMAGKIQKAKLAAALRAFRAGRETVPTSRDDSELAGIVKDVWAKTVGLDPSRLSLDTPISEFADSISVMRARDAIRQRTGKMLSLALMADAGTIAGHVDLLRTHLGEEKSPVRPRLTRDGPPGADDIAHVLGDADLLRATKRLVLSAISPCGFDWDDVEDIIPADDFISVMTETRLLDRRRYKFSIITTKANKTQAKQALEAVLLNNRLLASFFVRNPTASGPGDALHVTMRHGDKLFGKIFRDGGTLETVEELRAKALGSHDHVGYPGPLVRITLYDVEETGTSGVVMCVDHAVIDASTGLIINDDLEHALAGVPLAEHTDYKLWADSYFNQRTSAEATAAVKWHCKALEGLESHQKALWPPFTMPVGDPEPMLAEATQPSFEVPALVAFRKKHPQVTAPIILKAALALLNIHRTGHTHALFCNYEAARTSFPFLPRAVLARGSFEATDVSGPTIQLVLNLVEPKAEETAVSFLERMQEHQGKLTQHAAAPLRRVMASLGPAGALVPEVMGRQIFNWAPGMGLTGTQPHARLETLKAENRPHVGMTVIAGLGGPDSCTFFLQVRGTSFDRRGYDDIAHDLARIARWLVAEENEGRLVTNYAEALQ